MSRNWARILAGILGVGVVWIAAYWWLNPKTTGKISFGAGPAAPAKAQTAPSLPPRKVELVDLQRSPLIAKSARDNSGPVLPPTLTADPEPKVTLSPAAPRPSEPKAPAPKAIPPSPKPPPAVIPPRFNDYTVKSGDTLNGIASAELGSSKHADAIRRANPLKDLERIKVGDVIRIPADPTNIQGKPAAGTPAPTPPAARQAEMLEYTVRSGDTLSRIARDQYGSPTYQDLIYNANRDRLSGPNALKEGQKLRLPPKPKG
jgi:nucleoid-associated protein YgaU